MEDKKIQLVLVDDHPVVLQGFAFMFKDVATIELVATFSDADAAIAYVEKAAVDIVLLDINLPGLNGIDACSLIKKKKPHVRVIAISNINEFSIIKRMLCSGAAGYLLKNAAQQEVISCIEQVYQGETGLSESVKEILSRHQSGQLPVITKREKEVLALLAAGLSSVEIGDKIFISPLTVESHRRNLLQKFRVNNVAALVHKATEMKYI
ncbi:response regulator transcription factor [Pontibacter qinzhouensis]|uniref:Response regulator transcription factor n=1 Tax=Pontibacter qinzhouensis TaxID=2603253 RepID=A0A5C8KD66_9BACT|nr:response regulator transcription factor [Pontibacter qinzhouensis]TXK50260.1 response regulator transcription factor [Pontibacter qinzhouensis]